MYTEFILNVVDLYASEYGWTRDYILNNVYLDEYFIQQNIIKKRQRYEYMKQITVAMLPHMKNEERKKIIKAIEDEERQDSHFGQIKETDLDAIKDAKSQLLKYK